MHWIETPPQNTGNRNPQSSRIFWISDWTFFSVQLTLQKIIDLLLPAIEIWITSPPAMAIICCASPDFKHEFGPLSFGEDVIFTSFYQCPLYKVKQVQHSSTISKQETTFLFSSYLHRISRRTWLHTHIHSAHTYLGMDKIAVSEKQTVASHWINAAWQFPSAKIKESTVFRT